MPTHTFPCPFCAKKMGVGSDYLGRKVRCPNPQCNQVVLAPTPSANPVPLPPKPVVVSPPPPPPPPESSDLPVFNLPSREERESIFGEAPDESDDVFSSTEGPKLQVPDLPAHVPLPVSPTKTTEAAYQPTEEMESPLSGFSAPPIPPPASTQPVSVVVPLPAARLPTAAPIGATPPSFPGANPWAGMDELVATPVPLPTAIPTLVAIPDPDSPFSDEPQPKRKKKHDEPPEKRARATPTTGGSPLFKIGFFVLLPYAIIVTGLAIYGLLFKSSTPPGHPLSTIPDNFGEYAPAERKKSSKLAVPVDGDLPPELRVALGAGNKLEIGQLEIEPLGVEQRALKIVSEGKGEKQVQPSSLPAIVLRLKIRNTSDDLLIHPLDPAFNRRVTGTERVGTGLVVGKQTIWGGAIAWPFDARLTRRYEAAQEADATPLKPGETREYVVFTDAKQGVVKAVKEAKDALLWRVQVRRGRIVFDGKDVPVTAIVGVEFKSSDVKEPD